MYSHGGSLISCTIARQIQSEWLHLGQTQLTLDQDTRQLLGEESGVWGASRLWLLSADDRFYSQKAEGLVGCPYGY